MMFAISLYHFILLVLVSMTTVRGQICDANRALCSTGVTFVDACPSGELSLCEPPDTPELACVTNSIAAMEEDCLTGFCTTKDGENLQCSAFAAFGDVCDEQDDLQCKDEKHGCDTDGGSRGFRVCDGSMPLKGCYTKFSLNKHIKCKTLTCQETNSLGVGQGCPEPPTAAPVTGAPGAVGLPGPEGPAGPASDGGCFAGTSEVQVQGLGLVAMKNIRIGDWVKVGKNAYEQIYAMGHAMKDQIAEFLKIDVSGGQSVEVTGEHLLFLDGKDTPVRADAIKVGDVLETTAKQPAVVKKITTVKQRGLYTPLTPSGKVVVNDIHASSYIALQDGSKDTIKIGGIDFSHQNFVHFTLSPMRVVCMGISDVPCKMVASNGIPLYIDWGMAVVHMVSEGSLMAFAFFVVVGIPVLAAFNIAETLFGPTFAALGWLAVFAVYKYIVSSKKQIKQA